MAANPPHRTMPEDDMKLLISLMSRY
jgi:hypothetical protein